MRAARIRILGLGNYWTQLASGLESSEYIRPAFWIIIIVIRYRILLFAYSVIQAPSETTESLYPHLMGLYKCSSEWVKILALTSTFFGTGLRIPWWFLPAANSFGPPPALSFPFLLLPYHTFPLARRPRNPRYLIASPIRNEYLNRGSRFDGGGFSFKPVIT